MKTLVSLALGAVMLFGAATMGLQSGSAGARTRQDQNKAQKMKTVTPRKSTRHHRRHKHHKRHRRNHKLSY